MAKQEKKQEHLSCPYCDEEIMQAAFPYCRTCQVTLFFCPECRKPLPRENRVCPHCGAEIKG